MAKEEIVHTKKYNTHFGNVSKKYIHIYLKTYIIRLVSEKRKRLHSTP